jgi:PAS domain-containing protein
MPELSFRLIIDSAGAEAKLEQTGAQADQTRSQVEKPLTLKVQAENALATIRDMKIAFDGIMQVVGGVVSTLNGYLNAALDARQSATLSKVAFGEYAGKMSEFAAQMQNLTNFEGDQLLALMSKMAQTYHLNTDEIQQLTPAVLDFAEANKSTGMTVESAFDLMGRAVNGHTEMLSRYGLELDENKIKTEGVSYLVKQLTADYGGTAQALVDLRLQNANAWGDVQESIGDMLNVLITPLLNGLKGLFAWYNNLSPVLKGFVTGLAVAIPTIVSVTTVITGLTAAINALKVAINPVAGVIGIVVGALAALGFAYASTKLASDNATDAQQDFRQEVEQTTKSVDELVAEQREIATSIDYDEAKKRLKAIEDELTRYRDILEAMKQGPVLTGADFDPTKMNEMLAEEQALKERIRTDDAAAQSTFYREKYRLDKESTLEGVALLEYRLAEERKAYRELGALNAENADRKQATYERIKGLEKQLAQAHEDSVEALTSLDTKYSTAMIDDATARTQRELELERDAELSKAQALGASEELLLKIRTVYANRITQVEADAEAERLKNAEAAAREKERIAQETVRAEQENADTRAEFFQAQLTYENNEYQAQIDAIDNYYAQRRDKLLAAGITEEQITKQSELAKAKIRESFEKQHIAGVSSILGNLAKTADAFGKKGFALWKTFAIGQALVDTYSSATAAYKAMAGIPIVGPGLAIAAAAAAIGAGLANVAQISKTEPPKAARGGLLKGNSHAQGGILIEAEGDEFVTSRDRVKSLGSGLFNFLNFAPLSQVRAALGNIAFPAFPVPEPKLAYATGGAVGGSNTLAELIEAIRDMRDEIVVTIKTSKPAIQVSVDPLSADPVRISELADTGKRIRAEV